MKLSLLIYVLTLSYAHSETIKLLGRNFEFHQEKGIAYSSKCKKDCRAKKNVDQFLRKPFKLKNKRKFKTSKGSILCRDYWKGVSVIGIRENKNQVALCLFEDQSIVDLDSLTRRLDQ